MLAAVFFVSASALAFEVLLARAFAITQWNHLAFLVIGIALLGFAASGTWVACAPPGPGRGEAFAPLLVLVSLAILSSLCGLRFIPLDYQRLLLEPTQGAFLFGACLLFSLPFFFAGRLTAAAYLARPEESGRIYAASLAGSALGVAAPAVLLAFLDPGTLIAAAALPPLLPLLPRPFRKRSTPALRPFAADPKMCALAAFPLLLALASLSPFAEGLRRLAPSEFKFLAHARSLPATEIRRVAQDLRGEVDLVKSPHIRFAAGLSLAHTEALPPADVLLTDGDRPVFLYPPGPATDRFAARTLAALACRIPERPPEAVLAIVSTGGLSLAAARAAGATSIHAFHPNPHVASRLGAHYGVSSSSGQLRSLLSRTAVRYDLIQVEHWGASLPGAEALDQEHLFTRESLAAMLERLSPEGAVTVLRRLRLPPADTLRLWSSAVAALERLGAPAPLDHLFLFRSWDSVALVVFRHPPPDREGLLARAAAARFDLVYARNADPGLANRYHAFDRPYLFEEHRRLEEAWERGAAEAYFRDALLSAAPQSDRQPFPGNQLKWSRLADLYRATGGRAHVLGWSGEILVAVTLAGAIGTGAVLLLLPLRFPARKPLRPQAAGVLAFLALGGGFLFAELFFLHVGTFWLGDPGISLVLTLGGFLVASSLGGLASGRIGAAGLRRAAALAGAGFALPAAAALAALSLVAAREAPVRVLAHCGMILVSGFALGLPFAPALRHLVPRPRDKAYAWAANGCASAVASIASAGIAMEIGLHGLFIAGLACYAVACGLLVSASRPLPPAPAAAA